MNSQEVAISCSITFGCGGLYLLYSFVTIYVLLQGGFLAGPQSSYFFSNLVYETLLLSKYFWLDVQKTW